MCDAGDIPYLGNGNPLNPINYIDEAWSAATDFLSPSTPDYPDPSSYPTTSPIQIPEPIPRDYYAETADTLQAQIDMAPEVFRANLKYQPLYAALNYGISNKYSPKYAETGNKVNTISRTGDINDLTALAPQVSEAYRKANPEAAALLDELNKEASTALATGGALTPDEQRAVKQNARAAYNDRGMALSDPAVFAEVMNLDAAKRSKQQQNQQLASGVMGLNKSFYGDPTSVILGRQASNLGFSGIEAPTPSGSTDIFNAESPYASNLYQSNVDAANANNTANANLSSDYFSMLYNSGIDQANQAANNSAALYSSLISAGGNVVSSII